MGMGATVLGGAVIEEGGVLAAGGLLTNNKVIGPNELWGGAPAKLWRVMSAGERAGKCGAFVLAPVDREKEGRADRCDAVGCGGDRSSCQFERPQSQLHQIGVFDRVIGT